MDLITLSQPARCIIPCSQVQHQARHDRRLSDVSQEFQCVVHFPFASPCTLSCFRPLHFRFLFAVGLSLMGFIPPGLEAPLHSPHSVGRSSSMVMKSMAETHSNGLSLASHMSMMHTGSPHSTPRRTALLTNTVSCVLLPFPISVPLASSHCGFTSSPSLTSLMSSR
jgi:hypothetical protein